MDITPDMQSLLEKLDRLELTDGERGAFGQLLGAGEADDDVEGFYYNKIAFEFAPVQGFDIRIGPDRRAMKHEVREHMSDD